MCSGCGQNMSTASGDNRSINTGRLFSKTARSQSGRCRFSGSRRNKSEIQAFEASRLITFSSPLPPPSPLRSMIQRSARSRTASRAIFPSVSSISRLELSTVPTSARNLCSLSKRFRSLMSASIPTMRCGCPFSSRVNTFPRAKIQTQSPDFVFARNSA